MKRRRSHPTDKSTAESDRERIAALEVEVEALKATTDRHERELDVQLRRIAQLQADLDNVRAAWTRAKGARKR